MPPWLLWLGGLSVGGAVLYLIFSAPPDSLPKRNESDMLPLAQSENLRLLQLRDAKGDMTFEMSARLITLSSIQNTATAEDVSHAIYYQNGKPSLNLKAKKVVMNQSTHDVEATGQVSATGKDGFFVKCERVLWTQNSQDLHSPVAVKAGLRGNTFAAPKLTYNIQSGVLHCPEQSSAQVGQLSLEAREIVYDSLKGELHCPQSVTARTANLQASSSGVTYQLKSEILQCPQSVTAQTSGVVVTTSGMTYERKNGLLRCPQRVSANADGATMSGGSALINTISRHVKINRGVQIHVPSGANLQRLQNLPEQLAQVPTQGDNVKFKPTYLAAGLWMLASTSAVTNSVLAQKPADKSADKKAAPAKPQKKVDVGDVHITSDQLDYIKESATFILKGNVVVRQDGEDMVMHSDNAVYKRDANTATASGNLKVDTRDSTIVGLKLNADFDSKHVLITEKVFMRSHGDKDGLPDKEKTKKDRAAAVDDLSHKPSNMWCDKMDFNYDIQEALVTGNIKIKQENTDGTCNQLVFDEANNRAKLQGNVSFVDDEQQKFKCDLMYVWFDTGNIKVEGPFELTSPRKEKKDAPEKTNEVPRTEFPDFKTTLPDDTSNATSAAKTDKKPDAKADKKADAKTEKTP